jgi:hypothetical protein
LLSVTFFVSILCLNALKQLTSLQIWKEQVNVFSALKNFIQANYVLMVKSAKHFYLLEYLLCLPHRFYYHFLFDSFKSKLGSLVGPTLSVTQVNARKIPPPYQITDNQLFFQV